MEEERWYTEDQIPETHWETFALGFVESLVLRDFAAAHSMLALMLRLTHSIDDLSKDFDRIAICKHKDIGPAWVLSSIEDWPARAPNDCGLAYVQIGGDNNEAVTPLVRADSGHFEIARIEWGRP